MEKNENDKNKKIEQPKNIENYKKCILISLIVLIFSFISTAITSSNMQMEIFWNISKFILAISTIVYLISITLCTIIAKKNKTKLTGWLKAFQFITLVCIIFAIIIIIFGNLSDSSFDKKSKNYQQQIQNELGSKIFII